MSLLIKAAEKKACFTLSDAITDLVGDYGSKS